MIVTRENRNKVRETCPSALLSNKNLTRIEAGSKTNLYDRNLVTNRPRQHKANVKTCQVAALQNPCLPQQQDTIQYAVKISVLHS